MKITLKINKIDECGLGDWPGLAIEDVAFAYEEYVAREWEAELKSSYPDADIVVKTTGELSTSSCSVVVDCDDRHDEYRIESEIYDMLGCSDVWDRFCNSDYKEFFPEEVKS